TLRRPIQVQHVGQQTGLRQRAHSNVCYRMARTASHRELRYHIKHVSRSDRAQRQVPEDWIGDIPYARSVATQTILVLIDRGSNRRAPVRRVTPRNSVWGARVIGGTGNEDTWPDA